MANPEPGSIDPEKVEEFIEAYGSQVAPLQEWQKDLLRRVYSKQDPGALAAVAPR
jgi:hypothetical protein